MKVNSVPYVSNLTANRYGLSAWFSDSMSPDHVLESLAGIAYLQQPGRTANPDVLGTRQPTQTGCPAGTVLNAAGTGCITAEQAAAEPVTCGTFDIPCYITQALGSDIVKDYAKRVGLVVLAVIILAIAIISLR